MLKSYTVARVYKTGLCKPHTIELIDGKRISIAYYDEKYISSDLQETATATTNEGDVYRVFESANRSKALAIIKTGVKK